MEKYQGTSEWECIDFRVDILFQVSSPSCLNFNKSSDHPKEMMIAALDMIKVDKINRSPTNRIGSYRFKYTFNTGDIHFGVYLKIKPLSDVSVQIKDNYQLCIDRINSALALMLYKKENEICSFNMVDFFAGSGSISLN